MDEPIVWILGMVVWLVAAVLVRLYAEGKGLSAPAFFVVSLVFSPLVGFIVAAIAQPKAKDALEGVPTKKCPDCAETIRDEARKCRFCGFEFGAKQP